jgi:hypothetical protein
MTQQDRAESDRSAVLLNDPNTGKHFADRLAANCGQNKKIRQQQKRT